MSAEDRIRTGNTDDDQPLDRDEVARLAYFYWEERGRPHGGHDEDWRRAEDELRRRLRSRNQRTVLGVFQSIDDAQRAFGDLEADGFSRDEISLIANKAGAYKAETGRERAAELNAAAEPAGSDIAADAGIGAAIGGVGGLLLSFASLAIPGVGPIVAAGPIIAALGGAGIGAATGGIIGALTETGVPEEAARHYAEGIRRGDVLIAVRAEGAGADRAARILDQNGAIDIDDRVSGWRSRGWTGFDPDAAPLTADELRRERQYYSAAREQGREWTQMSQAKTGGGLAAAEAKNARKEAARTSRQANETIGSGRRDVENRDFASKAGQSDPRPGAARIYGRSPS
jgi:hypothetical protein